MWLSNFDVDIYNVTMDNFKLNSASYRTGTFYNDNLKDIVNSSRDERYKPLRKVQNTENIPLFK